jgi:hypothetical protein
MNNFDPPFYNYTVTIPARPEYYQYRYVESAEVKAAVNTKHFDGRIHAGDDLGEYYTAVSVSPMHPAFHTQIELGIRDVVYALLEKNYFTISSCEGHGGSSPFVRLALVDVADKDVIIKCLSKIPFVTCNVFDQSANAEVYVEDDIHKVKPLDQNKFSKEKEAEGINKLFLRNYSSYYFLDIVLYEDNTPWWNLLAKIKLEYSRSLSLKSIKKEVVSAINHDTFPVYNK